MKKLILSIAIPMALGVTANANTFNVVVDSESNSYKVSKWIATSPIYTEWTYGEEYDCSDLTPLLTDYNTGIDFEQTHQCLVDKTRTKQEQERNSLTGEFRPIGDPTEETTTETNNYSENVTGTYVGSKCLDVLNKGEHHGSGMYVIDNGDTVFCEMEVAGGGYQLKSTYEYIPDGNLSDGTGVEFEDGSNDTNTVVYSPNPVSNYAIEQDRLTSHTEYEIHPNVCDMKKGDYIALTLWQDSTTFWAFHNRYWDINGVPTSDSEASGTSQIIDTEVVNGKTWYKYRYIRDITDDARFITPITDLTSQTCHSWYIGYSSNETETPQFTGMSFQVYTK